MSIEETARTFHSIGSSSGQQRSCLCVPYRFVHFLPTDSLYPHVRTVVTKAALMVDINKTIKMVSLSVIFLDFIHAFCLKLTCVRSKNTG